MKAFRKILFASALAVGGVAPALAGDIVVSAPWGRATVRGASVAAFYFTIENKGKGSDRLLSATSDVSERAEIHETRVEDGIAKMRAAPEGVEIKPGATLVFKPGSFHLMAVGLKEPLFPGTKVHLLLTFAKAGGVPADLVVEPFGGQAPAAGKEAPAAGKEAPAAGKATPAAAKPAPAAPTEDSSQDHY
jgi:copper(I)-binding protein